MLTALFSRTSLILEDIVVSPRKILELIGSLGSNKAHGCDDVFVSMLKIRDEAIVLPLKLIETPIVWKRVSILIYGKRRPSCRFTKKKAVN